MVLLDEVVAHDDRTIRCLARSHRRDGHPLAFEGMLPAWAGVEYAAQAMAAHFSLTAGGAGAMTMGLLGGLRDVACFVDRLDDIASPLFVDAERLSNDAAGSIYAFRITAGVDGRTLVQGRATVVQQLQNRESV
jgi:predicted hotdog family 3-hydroxylacyl-ACP dehydratase